jgi:hypothetical protein
MLFAAPAYRRRPVFSPQSKPRVVCSQHVLPVTMKFIGMTTHHSGAPLQVFACPICNHRVLVGRDFRTGQLRVVGNVSPR